MLVLESNTIIFLSPLILETVSYWHHLSLISVSALPSLKLTSKLSVHDLLPVNSGNLLTSSSNLLPVHTW